MRLLAVSFLVACSAVPPVDSQADDLTVAATMGPQSFTHGTLSARTTQLAYAFTGRSGDVIAPDVWPTGQSALTPTLDGFTISGGGGGNHGGGIRATDSNALIRNNVITDNVGFLYGGGIWVQRGAPRIENNRIENNGAPGTLIGAAYSTDAATGMAYDVPLRDVEQRHHAEVVPVDPQPQASGTAAKNAIIGTTTKA